ncbi:hypothetical protein [Neisseria sp. Ec49-e6-T10]|uniref:hypothetical protein n=1 Tax=Neisseria sp. Ec49-e6-T10 TaxID=3140744 RepID=UPI003EBECBC4
MIRNDIYTLYQGKEYEIISSIENGDRIYQLRSLDPQDLKNGFSIYKRPEYVLTSKGEKFYLPPRDINEPDIYIKDIIPLEVSEVYGINTFGIYKGCEVGVRMEDKTGKNLLLGVGDAMMASKLGFEFDERGVYMKWVPKEEVELFEKKEPMPNYFK